ncbi:MAG TPA: PEGA domain-containing protein [Bacteroidota bacterium]|nr:PEGA domain-containing protein [Bacteroidota bacterium]
MSCSFLRYGLLPLFLALPFSSAFAQAEGTVRTLVADPSTGALLHAYDESYALIIGIDRYPGETSRTSSVAAARALKDLLLTRFGFREENTILLLDDQARRSVIQEALKRLSRRGPDDRLLIFFSGKGYTARDQAGVEYGFLVPTDGRTDSADEALATCLSLDDLNESINGNSPKQTLILLDCMVGGLRVGRQYSGPPPPRLGFRTIVTEPAKEVFMAGARLEPMLDDPKAGMSWFSSKLLESLSSEITDVNIDGIIAGTELASQTCVKVTEATDWKEHPQFGFMDGGKGDFLFILPSPRDTSRISFTVYPRTSSVFVDDKEVDWKSGPVRVPGPTVGVHHFQVQAQGYRSVRREFSVNGLVSLDVNLSLEKLPSRGLQVTISEPDAKIYVDGAFIGAPEQSLTIDPIAAGVHSVRAELDGYFPDSTRVQVTDTGQYTVHLNLISRNGFVTVRSSEAVEIALDGKKEGVRQMVRREVLPGTHTVVLSGIGYDTYEKKIVVHDSESVVFDHPLSRPTLTGAVIRSFIFPGWGQSYSGRHGIVYSVLFLALAGGTVEAQLQYTDANSTYRKKLAAYNAQQDPAVAAALLPGVSSARTKRNNFNYMRMAAGGLTGAFYLYDIINVWTHNPVDLIRQQEEEARKGSGQVSIGPGVNASGPAIVLTVRF